MTMLDEEALDKAAREGYAVRCKTHGPRILDKYASDDIMAMQLADARVIVSAYLSAAVAHPGQVREPVEITDHRASLTAMSNTDDADERKVLLAVLGCALTWEGDARIIGNVRASDIVRSLRSALALPLPVQESVKWESPEEWAIEQRAFHAAGRDDVPADVQRLVAKLWGMYCDAASPCPSKKGNEDDNVTVVYYATRLFDLHGFMLLETYRGKPAVTVTFPDLKEAQQFHNTLVELSQHRAPASGGSTDV